MAMLVGRWAKGESWFEIFPIPGENGKDATLFEVRFSTEPGSKTIVRRFSKEDWQFECEPLLILARGFSKAESIISAKINIDRWNIGKGDNEPAALYDYVDWLHVVMFGNPKLAKICIRLFIQEGEELDVLRLLVLNAPLEIVQGFGRRLEQEIIEACPNWWAEFSAEDNGKEE